MPVSGVLRPDCQQEYAGAVVLANIASDSAQAQRFAYRVAGSPQGRQRKGRDALREVVSPDPDEVPA
jgi:hypothetical protein